MCALKLIQPYYGCPYMCVEAEATATACFFATCGLMRLQLPQQNTFEGNLWNQNPASFQKTLSANDLLLCTCWNPRALAKVLESTIPASRTIRLTRALAALLLIGMPVLSTCLTFDRASLQETWALPENAARRTLLQQSLSHREATQRKPCLRHAATQKWQCHRQASGRCRQATGSMLPTLLQ